MAAYSSAREYKEYKRAYDRDRYVAGLKSKESCRRWAKTHPVLFRRYRQDWNLKDRYNISLDDYERMLKRQRDRCAVCKRPRTRRRKLHVDHCHKTARGRGLLCLNCNTALGHLGDCIKRVKNLVVYLKAGKRKTHA